MTIKTTARDTDAGGVERLRSPAEPAEYPPLPTNFAHVTRRIRRCYNEVAAQAVLEHALRAYVDADRAARAQAPAAVEPVADSSIEDLRSALQFYADKHHFDMADPHAWDTVSGEPQNFWCDEAGTATVEDGTVAAMALRGTPLKDEEAPTTKAEPAPVVGCHECYITHDLGACAKAAPADALDAERLNWLDEYTCDLRCVSTSEDDYSCVVIEHYMAEPREREIGWGHTARAAIDAAIAAQAALSVEKEVK